MKRIAFINHALYQLKVRGINQTMVRLALENPDREVKQANKRCQNIKKINSRFALVVIFEETETTHIVITAFKTSKLNKYL